MKKISIYCLIIIILLIIICIAFKSCNNIRSKQEEENINVASNAFNKDRTITDIEYKNNSTSEFVTLDFTNVGSIYLTREAFSNALFEATDLPNLLKAPAERYLSSMIFSNNTCISVTSIVDKTVSGWVNYHDTKTGGYYSLGLGALRYKSLTKYMANELLKMEKSSNALFAAKYKAWFDNIQHPDTLRTILELDKKISEDSYLRKGTLSIWKGALPLFYRNDCLDIYIDVVDKPSDFNYRMWNSAAYNIGWFTNEVAIQAYNRAYKVMENFKKYWPELSDSYSLNAACMKTQMKTRQKIIDGRDKPLIQPKPLLDE